MNIIKLLYWPRITRSKGNFVTSRLCLYVPPTDVTKRYILEDRPVATSLMDGPMPENDKNEFHTSESKNFDLEYIGIFSIRIIYISRLLSYTM